MSLLYRLHDEGLKIALHILSKVIMRFLVFTFERKNVINYVKRCLFYTELMFYATCSKIMEFLVLLSSVNFAVEKYCHFKL